MKHINEAKYTCEVHDNESTTNEALKIAFPNDGDAKRRTHQDLHPQSHHVFHRRIFPFSWPRQ